MSETNPYAAPEADLELAIEDSVEGLKPPRSVAAGQGWVWVKTSWALFKSAAGMWIAMLLVWLFVMIVLALIPILGGLLQSLFGPVFLAGFTLAACATDRGEGPQIVQLFAGFQLRGGALIGLGAINLLLFVVMVAAAFGFALAGANLDPEALASGRITPEMAATVGIAILLVFAVYVPVMMAIWFAPTLLVLHEELGLFQSMGMSFRACLKNILPFLIFGIVAFLLMILAMLPLGLGFLVLTPMLMMTPYTGYADIFLHRDDSVHLA